MYPANCNVNSGGSKDTRSSLLSEAQALIASSKALARSVKRHQTVTSLTLDEAARTLPARDVSNILVEHCMRIVEGPFRILHIVSFHREYSAFWDDPGTRRPLFIVILLLVMSIGVHFCYEEETEALVRPHVRQWVQTAQSWLSNTQCKEIATISGLQAQCLLSVSLQFNHGKPQGIWLAQGTLLRTAIYMGLHRDPCHFPDMPFYHVEMRRRLWSTVLELDVQVSMDLGMVPTTSDFDTLPPSNVDDDAFDETTTTPPRQATLSTLTQASLQIVLRSSLVTRMTIARLMNDSFTEPSYEDVLQETSTLTRLFAATEMSLELLSAAPGLTTVHRNLVNFLTRRFMLALHRPFATKAFQDPRYHYSRKICLDNALLLLASEPDRDFDQLLLMSVSLFRHIMHHATILIVLEIMGQIKEDQIDKKLLQIHQEDRTRLLAAVRQVPSITAKRLHFGETNVKSHVFLQMGIAQVEAMEQGLEITAHVITAATKSARQALEILQSQRAMNEHEDGHAFEHLGSELGLVSTNDSVPLALPENGDMDLELGDMASWLFSNWVDEYPL